MRRTGWVIRIAALASVARLLIATSGLHTVAWVYFNTIP